MASENPVYIQGNYNSNAADTFFSNPVNTAPANDILGHSAAAVIADAVTILSNNWVDQTSMGAGNVDVTDATTRPASTTYYRVAIAAGKNRSFPFPSWANSNPDYPFGTDGGVGNFLRLLEDWNSRVHAALRRLAGEPVLRNLWHRNIQVLHLLGVSAAEP